MVIENEIGGMEFQGLNEEVQGTRLREHGQWMELEGSLYFLEKLALR